MEALTNVIENNEKIILPFRSGDDGAPCAIARLIPALARISNQQKPKHKNLPQKIGFISFLKAMGFAMFQAQRQSTPQCRLLVLKCFLTGGCFRKRYGNIAAKWILGAIHGIMYVSYVMIGVMSMNWHSKFINFAYCQYFAVLKQFASWIIEGFFVFIIWIIFFFAWEITCKIHSWCVAPNFNTITKLGINKSYKLVTKHWLVNMRKLYKRPVIKRSWFAKKVDMCMTV